MSNLKLPEQHVSVINEVDTVIVGGSFAGISSALKLAKSGQKVMIIESRTYLGREMTATLTPWLYPDNKEIPDLLEKIFESSGKEIDVNNGRYLTFQVDLLKKCLEDLLLEENIGLLYATLPIGITTLNKGWNGLIIANKSGRQVIRCRNIIDSTETAIVSSLFNEKLGQNKDPKDEYFRRTLEFVKVSELEATFIEVPKPLQIEGNKVQLFPGYHNKGHMYVQFEMKLAKENNLEADGQREQYAQRMSIGLVEYLIQHHPLFKKAQFCSSSYELQGPFKESTFHDLNEKEIKEVPIQDLRLPLNNIWCFYKDFYENENDSWLNVVHAIHFGEQFAESMESEWGNAVKIEKSESKNPAAYQIQIPTDLIESSFDTVNINEQVINLTKTTEVLVVGGGSSGSTAAIVSAEKEVETLMVDMNPGFGGTGTFGGVDSYWFGKRHGFAKRITDAVSNIQERINYKGHKWNIEAKKNAFLTEASQAGVRTLFNGITFGAITQGNKVCGSLVATKWGVCSVLAECVIDATGDGDIATYAGAEYVYGSKRDHITMWYSLSQYKSPGKLQNNFTSTVNIGDIRDYTRAILAGRRRDRGEGCHDHGIYVAPRETRHIVGDVTMTLTDQLLHRKWHDVINIHFSNHDMKGISGAEWMNVGLIPPNLEIEVPYRMLLPKGLEGIFVVGKAMSATHDALPAIRMQSDLENLGGIVALAAAQAIHNKVNPRQVNVQLLQENIVEKGLIPESILQRDLEYFHYSDEELEKLVDSIEDIEPLYEYSNMPMNKVFTNKIPFVEICSVGMRIIPFLKKALDRSSGIRKVRIAQALAMYNSSYGVPTLIEEINAWLSDDTLPKRTADILYVTTPPDHGAMADVCYLIYSLGLVKDKRSIPVLERIVDLFNPTEEDYKDKMWGIFYYVHSVCSCSERLGDAEVVPLLERLHENTYLRNQHHHTRFQRDYYLERRSLLELSIGRALARCGSEKGYEILINYLGDVRSLLSKQAYAQLKRITGEEFNRSQEKWNKWLKNQKGKLPTVPYKEQLDMEESSENILRVSVMK